MQTRIIYSRQQIILQLQYESIFQKKKKNSLIRTCQATSQRPLALVVNSKLNLINLILTVRATILAIFLSFLFATHEINVR